MKHTKKNNNTNKMKHIMIITDNHQQFFVFIFFLPIYQFHEKLNNTYFYYSINVFFIWQLLTFFYHSFSTSRNQIQSCCTEVFVFLNFETGSHKISKLTLIVNVLTKFYFMVWDLPFEIKKFSYEFQNFYLMSSNIYFAAMAKF